MGNKTLIKQGVKRQFLVASLEKSRSLDLFLWKAYTARALMKGAFIFKQ